MKVFLVYMCRWGDPGQHSYPAGVTSSFEDAKKLGAYHRMFRGGKYEPSIQKVTIDDPSNEYKFREVDEQYPDKKWDEFVTEYELEEGLRTAERECQGHVVQISLEMLKRRLLRWLGEIEVAINKDNNNDTGI